jgi:hypothetical protein
LDAIYLTEVQPSIDRLAPYPARAHVDSLSAKEVREIYLLRTALEDGESLERAPIVVVAPGSSREKSARGRLPRHNHELHKN